MLGQEDPPDVTFHFIDYMVLVGMLALSMLIGVITGIKRKRSNTAGEYLLGNSVMSPFSVAFSLTGGMMSAITVLGNTGEVYLHGTQTCTVLVGVILSGLLIYHIILPVLYNLSLVSMIQYLELRFQSVRLRKVASASQVLSMLLMSSVMLYAPSLALTIVTGLSSTTSILLMGIVCTFYTSIGGVRGVIYADVLQTTIMYIGVILVVVCSCQEVGGLAKVWNIAANDSMIQFFNMDPNPFVRNTFWTTNSMGMFLGLFFFGINQVSHQRYCSVNSLAKAKSLCIVAVIGCIVMFSMTYLVGVALYLLYKDCDPLALGKIRKSGQILPYFVVQKLGHLRGVPGLFVATIYSAVLSSVSSSGNSLACLIWDDFLINFSFFKTLTDRGVTATLKILSLVYGVLGLLAALLVGQLGTLFQIAISTSSAISGPNLGLFLTGICAPWVNEKSAWVGYMTSFIINFWYVVDKLTKNNPTPSPLPSTTYTCLANLTTTTTNNNTTITTTTIYPATLNSTVMDEVTTSWYTLSDISYGYIGLGSIIVTMTVSCFASALIGMSHPLEVKEGTTHPLSVKLHHFLWRVFRGKKSDEISVQILTDMRRHPFSTKSHEPTQTPFQADPLISQSPHCIRTNEFI